MKTLKGVWEEYYQESIKKLENEKSKFSDSSYLDVKSVISETLEEIQLEDTNPREKLGSPTSYINDLVEEFSDINTKEKTKTNIISAFFKSCEDDFHSIGKSISKIMNEMPIIGIFFLALTLFFTVIVFKLLIVGDYSYSSMPKNMIFLAACCFGLILLSFIIKKIGNKMFGVIAAIIVCLLVVTVVGTRLENLYVNSQSTIVEEPQNQDYFKNTTCIINNGKIASNLFVYDKDNKLVEGATLYSQDGNKIIIDGTTNNQCYASGQLETQYYDINGSYPLEVVQNDSNVGDYPLSYDLTRFCNDFKANQSQDPDNPENLFDDKMNSIVGLSGKDLNLICKNPIIYPNEKFVSDLFNQQQTNSSSTETTNP